MDNQDEIKPEHREVEIKFPTVSIEGHLLVPKGPMLVCLSCPYEHSYSIPPNKVFKGTDQKGTPILEDL